MSKQFETVARWLDRLHYVGTDGEVDGGVDADDKAGAVRCRDCKYYNEKNNKGVNVWAHEYATCAVFDSYRAEPGGSCAWAERRDA